MKLSEDFIKTIERNCEANERDGMLHCKACGGLIHIDWFEKTLECLSCDEID